MSDELIAALIGAGASILAAWLFSPHRERGIQAVIFHPRLSVLAFGLAITALFLSVFSCSEAQRPQLQVVTKQICAYTTGAKCGNIGTPVRISRVPDTETAYDSKIGCGSGYRPIAAWHETKGSHPALDVMYTIDAEVKENRVIVNMRARRNKTGYAYIDIIALCSRTQ